MKNKNKAIFNFGRLMLMLCILIAVSCEEEAWDDHYEQLDSRLETDILSALSEDPDYSTFVQYLNQTGYSSDLATAQAYTVWAPNNAAFEQVPTNVLNNPDLLKQLIGNHISLFSYNTANNDNTLVKMLNNKYVEFLNTNGESSFGDVDLVEQDILASNGIIHTISEVLEVNPNIWGYLNDNPDEFPTLFQFFTQFNETGFDEANSVVTGTNTLGQPVYDSIFSTTNAYFKIIGDLGSEEERFTFIGLTDDLYNDVFDDFDDYYNQPLPDTVKTYTDRAIFRNLNFQFEDIDELNGPANLTSTTGGNLVIDQSSIIETVDLSNGNLLIVNELNYDPKDVFYKPIRYEIENADRRTVASLTDFTIQQRFDPFASGRFTNVVSLFANPTSGNGNNFFEIAFTDVLSASYNLNLKFSPVGAAQDTKLRFEVSYIGSDFLPTVEEIGPIVISNQEEGVITIGDPLDFSWYVSEALDNYFFVKVKVIVDVSEPELILYDRRFGIDYAELVPTE